MIDKGKIISNVLLMLGNTRDWNEPTAEEHMIANRLFDRMLDEMFYNKRLLFNAATVKLNYAVAGKNHADEYKYLIPAGMVNLISPADIRLEGEYLYSKNEDQYVKYCKKVPINEIPEYMSSILTYRLAMEMCITYSQYRPQLELYIATYNTLYNEMTVNEIDNYNRLGR